MTGALSPSLIFPLLKQYRGRTEALREFKNTATWTASFITAFQMLREEAELVAPQLSKLLKSRYTAMDMIFKERKPQNVIIIETGPQSNSQLPDFLLFEVLRK